MPRLLTVFHLTLYEARRRRIVAAAAICGLAFLIVFAAGVSFAYGEMMRRSLPLIPRQRNLVLFTVAGLYATNFLTVLFAVLLPVDALSGEIDSGVMQTLASKPIRRSAIVLGKWLAHGTIVTAYLALLSGGVLLTGRIIAGYVQVNVARALLLMLIEVILLVTVSIAGGTRLSTVTNGVMALGFYGVAFIGGWIEQIAGFSGIESARTLGVAVSLISPPDALWRLAAYYLQPPFVRDIGAAVFTAASVQTQMMVWWAAGFTIVTLVFAVLSFGRRQL